MKLRLITENMANPFADDNISIPKVSGLNSNQHSVIDDDPFDALLNSKNQKDDDYSFNLNPEFDLNAAKKIIREYAAQVSKFTPEQILSNNSGLYISDMIDSPVFEITYPFIYNIYGDRSENPLHFGEQSSYHNELYGGRSDLHDSYYAHSAGRIGSGMKLTEEDYTKLHNLVDMWDDDIKRFAVRTFREIYKPYDNVCFIGILNMDNNQQACVKAVKEYAQDTFGYTRFVVLHNRKLYDYNEFVNAGMAPEVSEEDKEKGELQVALHVGAWPDGKPLTAIEKKQIRQKLGLGPVYSNRKTWRSESNNIGLTRPGQKWWAMTSESKR